MSLRTVLLSLSLVFVFSAPMAVVYSAGLIPQCPASGCRLCDLVTLANNVITFIIQMSVFVAVLLLVVAGFKSIIAGESAELGSTFFNIVIGIVIMLCGWLVIDTVLKVLIGGQLGPWNQIQCVDNPVPTAPPNLGNGTISGVPYTGVTGGGVQCAAANTSCSPASIMATGLSQAQANAMSCIAMTESSGVPSTPPYNQTHPGSNSTACGTFQITRTTWNSSASGACSNFSSCTDASCNVQVAAKLVQRNGYSDWTCRDCNNKAQACINKFDPGH